jgi:hypothetical protein
MSGMPEENKRSVFKYLLNADLNSAVSFFRLMRLNGKLLNILMPA